MHVQISGEFHFYKASLLLGLLLKYAGLQKIIFWASVWESGFQRMHIQFSVNLSFSMFCLAELSAEVSAAKNKK